MNDKHLFTLDVVSSIDEDIIDKNLKKRFELWFKKSRRKSIRWTPIVAAAACLCILISVLVLLMPGADTRQVPVYRGMTVSNEAPSVDEAKTPATYPTFSLLSAPTSTLPSYEISLLGDGDGNEPTPPGPGKPEVTPPKPGKGESNAPDVVFGETYYAMKNEDIYIYIHLSNPDEFEILSFTLNGKKYSSNMFEYGSDLQTLILKYNVGDVDGLQEYTIDAIKYVDGEKIKDVRMEGDKTVKVLVNDEKDLLQFNAQLSFTTLTIAPTKPLLSLALYEGDTLLRTLSPSDTTIADLPFDKRLILKATYSDGTRTREAQHIFDTQKLSQGLIIDESGVIRGMGSCTDTILYINNPVGNAAFSGVNSILKVYMGPGVTSIGEEAFSKCSSLAEVQLSDTLTSLGIDAFSYTGITSIVIPSGITTLPDGIFADCEKLSDVILHDNIHTIGPGAFSACSSLASITLPSGLNTIGDGAFKSCKKIANIFIPYGVTSIGKDAFVNCSALTSIVLSDSIISIGEHAFDGCPLASLTLPSSLKELPGKYWFKHTSISYLVIPGSLGTMGEFSFNGARNSPFETIIITEGMKRIEWAALADNDKLVKVVLPASITYLGNDIFNICPKLSELHFEGTKAQWESISKDPNWKGRENKLTVVHCTDGDVRI